MKGLLIKPEQPGQRSMRVRLLLWQVPKCSGHCKEFIGFQAYQVKDPSLKRRLSPSSSMLNNWPIKCIYLNDWPIWGAVA